jgi:hypothetical protein
MELRVRVRCSLGGNVVSRADAGRAKLDLDVDKTIRTKETLGIVEVEQRISSAPVSPDTDRPRAVVARLFAAADQVAQRVATR